MVVGWAQVFPSGKFSVPTAWMMSWSFIISYGDTFWNAEQFSRTKGSQHPRVLQALPPRAKERSRRCTKCAGLQTLASQVFFSIWEGVWGTTPSFPFLFGHTRELLLKNLKQNGISAHLWNVLALALVGRHQSVQEELSQRCSGSQYTDKDFWFQLLEQEFTSSSRKQRFDR